MNAIRIVKTLDSETLHLPELKGLIGKRVEIIVLEETPSAPGGGEVDLRARGIGEAQAAELRWRFQAVAEDWDRPEMDVYDAL